MKNIGIAILCAVCACAMGCAHTPTPIQPDVAKSRPLGRCADMDDIARMRSVEGHDKSFAITTLGHPERIWTRNGTEVWKYAWPAFMIVTFSNDVATSTFYDSGD